MRCHYEVLGISKDAEESQIKSAYKRLALKWHPDKNLENSEEAKEQFQLVQQAYEVLSDRHERAWYDSHREQILHGSNSEFQDNSLDVFQYFTTTCFKGYGDAADGFYSVYRNVFEKLAKEDLEFMEDKDEYCQIPSFGDSKSDYDEVVGPFYAYWTSYSTKKSYVWLDPYNIKEARDRRILKLIEKENKKNRQKAKKERNDEVRNLVAFVRKRDKRVQEHAKQIEAKILENRQKHEQISKQKRLERKQQHTKDSQAEWTKFDNVKSELEEIERRLAEQFGEQLSDSDENEEDENIDDNLYCVACNKVFKTSKALQNHEASRKHKENFQILQETMLEEENDISESSEELENDLSEEIENNLQNKEKENLSDFSESDSEISYSNKKQKKKNKKKVRTVLDDNLSEHLETITNNDEIGKFSDNENSLPKNTSDDTGTIENVTLLKETKEKNKKQKRNKEKPSRKENNRNSVDVDVDHCCASCKSVFPSKNKLFNHLKTSGHSVLITKEQKKISRKKASKVI